MHAKVARATALVVLTAAAFVDGAVPVTVERAANACRFADALVVAQSLSPTIRPQREIDVLQARILIQLERRTEAEALLARWAKTGSRAEMAETRFLLGLALAATPGREKDALAALNAARTFGADEILVLGAEGVAAAVAGDEARSEALFLDALGKDPTLTGALYNLGSLRARQGRLAEAAALVRQAWHLGWRNVAKLRTDPWLSPLRKTDGLISDLLATSETESRCPTW